MVFDLVLVLFGSTSHVQLGSGLTGKVYSTFQ